MLKEIRNGKRVIAMVAPAVLAQFGKPLEQVYGALKSAGFDDVVDAVVMVYAPESLRLQRAMKRDQASETQVRARMAAQMDDEEKRRRADFVICTDGNIPVEEQITTLVSQIKALK